MHCDSPARTGSSLPHHCRLSVIRPRAELAGQVRPGSSATMTLSFIDLALIQITSLPCCVSCWWKFPDGCTLKSQPLCSWCFSLCCIKRKKTPPHLLSLYSALPQQWQRNGGDYRESMWKSQACSSIPLNEPSLLYYTWIEEDSINAKQLNK